MSFIFLQFTSFLTLTNQLSNTKCIKKEIQIPFLILILCRSLKKRISNSISDQIPSSNQILQFNDMNPSTEKLTNNLDRAIPEISWVSIIFRTSQISNYGRGQRLKVGLLKPDAATEISCKVSSIFWTFTLKTGWIPSWH